MTTMDRERIGAALTGPGGRFELGLETVNGHPVTVFRHRLLVIGDGPRLERLAGSGRNFRILNLDNDFGPPTRRFDGAVPELAGIAEDDPGLILFTSGTTGRAKAVTLSHRSVVGFAQVNMFQGAAARMALGAPAPRVAGSPQLRRYDTSSILILGTRNSRTVTVLRR
ncbi:AMP-binding protein [Nocardia sp. alder85J]|uniref:AMP-binding protein n=1 Tax=Nocardia sp. alder85J TaxID=2862949 RepID=UPI001CD6A07B|nr:AMP-binding protein [Nocardia sp. alder85J]MCX4096769.1 AMP-binding protein [Nocardia sp. alder85J]